MRDTARTALAHLLSFVGSEVVVGGLALLLAGALVLRRAWVDAATVSLAIGGSAFLTVALKVLVARARPGATYRLGAVDHSYSFPSGHTLNSAVLIVLVIWLLRRRNSTPWPSRVAPALLTVLGVGIGASRVYLGYHWLSDVLASWLVAGGWLGAVWLLLGLWQHIQTRSNRPQTGVAEASRDVSVRPRG